MRPIKFRGKSIVGKKWEYGYLIKQDQSYYIVPEESEKYLADNGYYRVRVDSATVDEYIGLNDKNNIELYENDLIRVKMRYYGSDFEAIYRINTMDYSGLSATLVQLITPDVSLHNILSFKAKTFCTDYRGLRYDRLAVDTTYIANNRFRSMDVAQEYSDDIEKIGNIHDNPEFLEEK